MDRIRIAGGRRLAGRILISGAKNAALPLMCASLLTDATLTLANLPHLTDISTLASLLGQHGVVITMNGEGPQGHHGRTLSLTAGEISSTTAPYDLVRQIRASVLVLGPLVARMGHANVALPGGDAIGIRPVDLHLKGLAELGAEVALAKGFIEARAPHGLKGARIVMPSVSVGATENLMMAATLAAGETVLVNAAREPEVADLARCLSAMGADIEGIGSDTIRIRGQKRLGGTSYSVIADRIEAGTYAIAAAITGGEIELIGIELELIEALVQALGRAGVRIEPTKAGARVTRQDGLVGVDVMTEPYPGFPTDLQAQMMALMATAKGASLITETIFENRFMHVPELARLGADINVHGRSALVRGVQRLNGAPVMATDVRASVCLVLAGLAAEGTTEIDRVYHLDRGYEQLEGKLAACGAEIERIRGTGA
ncbi:MAG: UDP-N-acetylglucosamine 1-carboxyvinyltransferase [Proteobacteria bacterium]|nr:UDP-N-acetylglucosamine 1-carboxyvinyltransferase [Pseudomonadota bacterium]MBI3498833.1 UDP-N-acetylglucosamine 1-carboxyvinyltransferase [Pseudomonadota bacterium]